MTELMRQEIREIFYMFFAGQGVMLLFYLRDFLCVYIGSYGRFCNFVRLSFWIIASFLAYQFAYCGAYGVISWYSLLAFAGGIVLWKYAFCDIITLYDNVQIQIGELKDEEKDKRTHSKVRRRESKK